MKNCLFFALFFLLSLLTKTNASCGSNGFHAWPEQKTIGSETVFMLEAYALSRQVIEGLNEAYPIYLEGQDGTQVPLEVTSIYESTYRNKQAILKPSAPLQVNQVYFLKIDGMGTEDEKVFGKYNARKNGFEPFQWQVVEKEKRRKPRWRWRSVSLEDKKTVYYGAEAEVYAKFHLHYRPEEPVLIFVILEDLTEEEVFNYYLPHQPKSPLKVGHDMCSGTYQYKEGHEYRIRFSIMTLDGRLSKRKSKPIRFDSPFEPLKDYPDKDD